MEQFDVVVIGGGQSGLAAASALIQEGLRPVVLEASDHPVGSWPGYYDSLLLFSPARFSALPGLPFGGDGDRYPHRDEVADYLSRYADRLGAEVRTRTRVASVERAGAGFNVTTADGRSMSAAGIVAATGAFGNPLLPALPGQEHFTGEVLHAADYRNPEPYAGKRVVVVGGGNTAVQVGYELAQVAEVTLASRSAVQFLPQIREGRDVHHWLTATGFDQLPPAWLIHYVGGTLVLDSGRYRKALESGQLARRSMFTTLEGDAVVWADGAREKADTVLLATGYRPSLDYLKPLGALDADGMPLHSGGLSLTHPGLVYLGLEFQRSFASNTLRGVGRDAEYVIAPLAAHIRKAPAAAGL
ncbi:MULTISPECIES: NAD(P)/FAD-dependent oxidoreductase [Streptomyces]|uniref:flavin-containing monooxygenase n=1 Tax=Streptomyces TaxID=1883 RepID=UPI00205BBCCC|nr:MULTISPECIES: NAD(P)/FAD-dependent oxidoreductase [Streptomyces]UPT43233.1 NAD(P)/FAD-dependent oxidoreductase [Streptomyces sp. WAC00303]WIY77429.1 NAD(P)/FAD-dependent oxidoreductase [Streptomyces anulatus]